VSALSGSCQLIILGDFNAQNELWGSTRSNPSGVALGKFIANSAFRFLNDGSGTRISASFNHRSVPDISFTDCSDFVFGWSVGEDSMGSDHLPVSIVLSNGNVFRRGFVSSAFSDVPKKPELSLVNFDKSLFPLLVEGRINSVSSGIGLLDPLHSWYDLILECAIRAGAVLHDGLGNKTECIKGEISSLPIRLSRSKHGSGNRSLWWDKECEILVNKRKFAFKKLAKCPSKENLFNYRSISSLVRKGLQRKKRESFRDFVKGLNMTLDPRKFWDAVKKFKNSHYFKANETCNFSKQEEISSYISKLAPLGQASDMPSFKSNHFPTFFNHKIQLEELKDIIESVNLGGSPGPDLVSYSIIKLIPDIGLRRLGEIFEEILSGKFFPELWRNYTVVLLQKPAKRDFRPIALASCLLKVLERIVKRRLERFFELDYQIPNSQYGFRKGRSCEDCLSLINLEIYKSFLSRERLGALFLDIRAAYDNVIPSILLETIDNLKIPIGYKKFIGNILNLRHIEIYESGFLQGKRTLYRGLPQGSVLSPILFSLYIRDIIYVVPYNCKIIQFADDIAILCRDSAVDRIFSSLSSTFDKLDDWLSLRGLELLFRKHSLSFFIDLEIGYFRRELECREDLSRD